MSALALRTGTQELEDRGSGSPLFWLPSCFGEAPWLPIHEQLATSYRVIVVRPPTFRDGTLGAIRDMPDYVLHLVDVLDALGLERAILAGTSFGAWAAAELAAHHPHRVSAIALIGAMGLRVPDEPATEIFGHGLRDLPRLLFHQPEKIDATAFPAFDPNLDRMEATIAMLEGQETMARLGWSPYLHDARLPAVIRRYRGPALVIWGAGDAVLPLGHAQAWTELLGARLEVLEGAGHLAAVERPGEVAVLITDWMRSLGENVV